MELLDLFDPVRQRRIPVARYEPPQVDPEESRPTLIFSVGFGGGRAGYAFLARSWTELGMRELVVEHVGSNLAVLHSIQRDRPRHQELARRVGVKAREPEELLARPQDLFYVADQFAQRTSWLGLAGHSFGSYTVIASVGQAVLLPRSEGPPVTIRLKRQLHPRGLLALSPQPPDQVWSSQGLPEWNFNSLWITGTHDSGMPAGVDFRDRLKVGERLRPPFASLALVEGADHMSFAGIGLGVRSVTESLSAVTQAFWRACASSELFSPPPLPPSSVYLWGEQALQRYRC